MQPVSLSDNLSLSPIIYGLWRLTDDPMHSTKHLQSKIEACLDQGITSFDQADIYGGYSSEAELGKVLKQAPQLRQNMEIITKCDIVAPIGIHSDKTVKHYDTSAPYINQAVERSLTFASINASEPVLSDMRVSPWQPATAEARWVSGHAWLGHANNTQSAPVPRM